MTQTVVRNVITNCLRNPGFERGDMEFWQSVNIDLVIDTTTVRSGNYSCKGTITGLGYYIEHKDYIPVREGEKLHLRYQLYHTKSGVVAYVVARFYDEFENYITEKVSSGFSPSPNTWTEIEQSFIVPEKARYVKFAIRPGGTTGDVFYIDDCSLQVVREPIIAKEAVKFAFSTIENTSTLVAGATETVEVSPPSGVVYQLLQARLQVSAPPGATTGSHKMVILSIDGSSNHIDLVSTYNVGILFRSSHVDTATKYYPSDDAALLHALTLVYGTNSRPIVVQYKNHTDADQTNTRTIKLVMKILDEI